jgi:N-acyl-D-aspartate/D-glutamate deacylase
MLDIILRGGLVYDGTGEPARRVDIGLRKDRIALMGDLRDHQAGVTLDATGKVILPGMIDVHTHTDMQMMGKPKRLEALMQGVTTEITGACGIGVFPLSRDQGAYLPTVRAILGDHPRAYADCAAYLAALPATGTNVAVQVSHSPLRMETIGCTDRPLTADELRRMQALARDAFEQGACGLSTGLAYYPASFGDTAEVVALCRVAAAFDAPVSVHQRTAFRAPCPAFDPREEVLDFARQSGARLQFSHYRTKPSTAGQTDALLNPIRRGLAQGLRLTADFYPYPVGAGYAAVILPMWAMEGGFAQTMERLTNPACKARLLRDILANNPALENGVVTHAPGHPQLVGMTYAQIAGRKSLSIAEMLLELLAQEELNVGYRLETDFDPALLKKQELDFLTLLKQPYAMLGSDALPGQMLPHPRGHGAFAKMLRLTIEHGVDLSLFAHRTAALPAQTFGLKDRGVLREGALADMCVFAPEQMRDQASFEQPERWAVGMDAVIVNGQMAVMGGKPTGICAGRALRRGIA